MLLFADAWSPVPPRSELATDLGYMVPCLSNVDCDMAEVCFWVCFLRTWNLQPAFVLLCSLACITLF
jgi:hypothetical protein